MTIKSSSTPFRISSTAISAVLAVTIGATTFASNANAGKKERLFFGGVAAGIIGTAIIANEARHRRESRRSRWERHVDRCYAAYRSYDEESDTYIDLNGNERRCRK